MHFLVIASGGDTVFPRMGGVRSLSRLVWGLLSLVGGIAAGNAAAATLPTVPVAGAVVGVLVAALLLLLGYMVVRGRPIAAATVSFVTACLLLFPAVRSIAFGDPGGTNEVTAQSLIGMPLPSPSSSAPGGQSQILFLPGILVGACAAACSALVARSRFRRI